MEIIREIVATQQRAGLDLRLLESIDEVREIAPAVAPTVLAASFCPTDGHADPQATVAAFQRAAKRHGAVFRLGENVRSIELSKGAVTGVTTDAGRIDCCACPVAGGVRSNDLLGALDLEAPMRVMMTTVIQSEPIPPLLEQVLGAATANFRGGSLPGVSSGVARAGRALSDPRGGRAPCSHQLDREAGSPDWRRYSGA